ncbi:MAG: hypothetical protein ACLFUG_11815, partial [Nitriliruptoraceae bacterium]
VGDHLDLLGEGLAEVVDRVDPELLLLPWPLDGHPDHGAVAAALARRPLRSSPELWGYEVHTPILRPDRVVDVSTVIDRVDAALAEHATAAAALDLTAVRGLARYRSLASAGGVGHAEAFVTLCWSDLPAWVSAAAQVPVGRRAARTRSR